MEQELVVQQPYGKLSQAGGSEHLVNLSGVSFLASLPLLEAVSLWQHLLFVPCDLSATRGAN